MNTEEMDLIDEIIGEELKKLREQDERNEHRQTTISPDHNTDGYTMRKTQENGKYSCLKIQEIKNHRNRAGKLKLQVIFEGFSPRGQTVDLEEIETDHSEAIAKYVIELEEKQPKSYSALIKRFPQLLKLIKN